MAVPLRILGIVLFPLTFVYTVLIWLRNRLYDWGIFKTCTLDVPAVSVGNIQIGGTGKTPLAEYVARSFLDQGKTVAVLTRGYRREYQDILLVDESNRAEVTPAQTGDEPFMLLQNLPGVVMGIGGDRCRAAQQVLEKYPDAVFVLDDAFQHRRMPRQRDIVLVDAVRWPAVPFLFPLTSLRDVKSSLKRAHSIILSRASLAPEKVDLLQKKFEKDFGVPVLRAEIIPHRVVAVSDEESFPPEELSGRRVAAFCGLANPGQFFDTLIKAGGNLIHRKSFPDHHAYSRAEIEIFCRKALEQNAQMVITTQKDAVKLRTLRYKADIKIFYLAIDLQIEGGLDLTAFAG